MLINNNQSITFFPIFQLKIANVLLKYYPFSTTVRREKERNVGEL